MVKVHLLKGFDDLEIAASTRLKGFYPAGSEILVKIHFGEPGNKTALFPKDVEPIVKALKSLGLSPTLIDTPVAYSSPRDTVEGYEKGVKERGYDKLAPFAISNTGVKIKTKDFTAEVCKELTEADNVLVLSHVKGHECSGFGGAVKNLGMGGVTKATKSKEHGLCKPKFVSECQGCGTCAEVCPAGAIKMVNGKAKIDLDKCWGCSICQLECEFGCLAPRKSTFDDLLAQGAVAVMKKLPKKTYYVNLIKRITKSCDCEVDAGEIVAKDIGVLFSESPVAIDKASVDLVNQAEGKDVFREVNNKAPLLHVEFAAEYLGEGMEYELVEISG